MTDKVLAGFKDRQAKLAKARELGVAPYGSRFTSVTANAEIRAAGRCGRALEAGD